jgi:hypothetical protein
MYVCLKCGNNEEFEAEEYGSCGYRWKAIQDGEGDTIDNVGEPSYDDYDNDGSDDRKCRLCGSDDIEWMEEDEYPEWREEFQRKEREKTNPTDWKGRYRYIKYKGKKK